VGGAYGLALAASALLVEHPLALGALLLATLLAGAAAGVAGELRRALPVAVGVVVLTVVVNVLVSRQGLTVFARLGNWGPLGQEDLTVEALVYGLIVGLRWVVVLFASVLVTAAVDPDELLRAFRRVSPHSALSATLATRLVPVLFEDGVRVAEAQRCRADGGVSGARGRLAVLRAVVGGALDRALDVAAALEVRGYGATARPGRMPRAWSRHDLGFAAAAVAVVALATSSRVAGVAPFDAYPLVNAGVDGGTVAVAGGLLVAALAPFADRRGIEW
jgi:energy-coupling factor transport system permease protein